MSEDHVWTRREDESSVEYEAFREYLRQGLDRSNVAVAEALGKSSTLMNRWSSTHDWVARSVAYDRYLATAETDGEINRLAESRDKVLDLMDKLTYLLDLVLDDHIANREPPTVRWSQAANIAAQVQRNFLLMKTDQKSSESVVRVEKLVERIEAMAAGQ